MTEIPEDIREMDKAVICLYLELPESVANDVKKRWEAVKNLLDAKDEEIEWLKRKKQTIFDLGMASRKDARKKIEELKSQLSNKDEEIKELKEEIELMLKTL